jgi:hypothetical protein
MATNFPTSLDALTNPTSSNKLNDAGVLHADQHANANDAIEALEAKVGINSSADTNSLDYKVRNVSPGTTSSAANGFGYMGMPQVAATTGAVNVAAADAGKHIYSTATRTITILSNASLALPTGTVLTFISGVGATTTIQITADTMYLAGSGTTGNRTLAPYGIATAVKIASTTWIISGNGLT